MAVKVDFSKVEEAKESNTVWNGKYSAQITKVETKTTKSGDEMWAIELTINYGKFSGKVIKDNLVFSGKALERIKKLFNALGFDTSGNVTCNSGMLQNQYVMIKVEQQLFNKKDKDGIETGEKGISCKPVWAGYYPISDYEGKFDQELYDPCLLPKTKTNNDEVLIGDEEIPF